MINAKKDTRTFLNFWKIFSSKYFRLFSEPQLADELPIENESLRNDSNDFQVYGKLELELRFSRFFQDRVNYSI